MDQRFENKIRSIDNLRFDNVIELAKACVPDQFYDQPWAYFPKDENGNRSFTIKDDDGIFCYLSAYGNWHLRKLQIAFDGLRKSDFHSGRINIVDWGCGQGLGSVKFLDYMEQSGIKVEVDNVILIEPSPISLEYAGIILEQRTRNMSGSQVRCVCKLFGDLQESDLLFESEAPVIHIFSNVLDVYGINMKGLTGWFRSFRSVDNYVVVASPYYVAGNQRISTFFSYLNAPRHIFWEEQSDKLQNPYGNFTYYVRINKLLAEAIRRVRDLRFFAPRQFFGCSRIDALSGINTEKFRPVSVFDVYAPYELGTSFRDDIDPVLAVLSNIITRGLPTKASPFVEEQLANVYKNSEKRIKYGGISYDSRLSPKRVKDAELALSTKDASSDIASLAFTPIGVSRIEKTIIEALISGRISLDSEKWSIVVEESDVPCAALAVAELKEMFTNLVSVTEDYSHLCFPDVELTIVNASYPDSPLHLGNKVYSSYEDVPLQEFDMAIDYTSSVKGEDEYPFSKYNVKNECYYAIFSAEEVVAQRYVYTTDLITYRRFSDTDETGQYSENIMLAGYLEYFLQLIFRKESFRVGQLPILTRALRNKSVIGLLPTGGGKSLTYQLAALLQPGITIVIDPLRSLMLDQYEGLLANGIDTCTYINSSIDREEREQREFRLEQAQCQIVFLSPERLCIYSFRKRLQNMHEAKVYFAYGVIDEVHCVSEWGQDFRFSYLHLGRNLYQFVRAKEGEVTLFGLTATASFDVLADVERELSGSGAYRLDADALVRCEDTNRLELQYRILPIPIEFSEDTYYDKNGTLPSSLPRPYSIGSTWKAKRTKSDMLFEVISEIPEMAGELMTDQSIRNIVYHYYDRQHKEQEISAGDGLKTDFPDDFYEQKAEYPQAGIVFCPHRKSTDVSVDVSADKLRASIPDVGIFYSSDSRSGATEDVENTPIQNMQLFRDNKQSVMVATKAFGMGIDKPNVRFTVNMNYSDSLEAYVQEAGRAGRDRAMAISLILVSDYRLIRINRDCPDTSFPMGIIKNHWFKEEDLDYILSYYRISIDKTRWCSYCNPNVDVVKLACEEDAESFKQFCNGCAKKGRCGLERVRNQFKGWGTYRELQDAATSCGVKLAGRNIVYQSPDYQNRMYFYNKSYPGRNQEKNTMIELMSGLTVRSFIGDTVEVAKTEVTQQKGFLDTVLQQKPGTEIVVIIGYDGLDEAAFSKAIYRMCCIGLIDDFTMNYAQKTYRVVCRRKADGDYYQCLKEFLMRYYPQNKAEREIEKAKRLKGQNEIHKCLGFLTEFIYENLAIKKKRAIDDIRTFCNIGLDNSRDWKELNEDLKDYIYYYFNSKYAKDDYCLDSGEPYSLTRDTDFGRESSRLDLIHKYVRVVEDEVCGASGNPIDNVKHLQGAVRLISRAITGTNPVIDLLNVFCMLFLKEYRLNESIRQTLENCYSNAYGTLWEEMEDKKAFYSFFANYKRDIYEHGADKDFDEVLDMLEMNAEIMRHREFLDSFGWIKDKKK